MKEYNVKLTQHPDGTWNASTPKTVGAGKTASAALRDLADALERKGAKRDPRRAPALPDFFATVFSSCSQSH